MERYDVASSLIERKVVLCSWYIDLHWVAYKPDQGIVSAAPPVEDLAYIVGTVHISESVQQTHPETCRGLEFLVIGMTVQDLGQS